MEIPLCVLVLQIGFNAALNNRGYSSNSVIPSPRFENSGQTRRLLDAYNYMSLFSRGVPESDEQTESEYSNSFEENNYRSVRPLQSRSDQKRNDYLNYEARPGNDVSLETAPVRRINLDNYDSSYLSRRADPYFLRPYLRNRPSNLIPSPNPQYYRKANDDLSLEVSSLESSNSEDASRLGEEANYLRSLLSLIEQPSNRRVQSRKYYRQGNSLSIDMSPIDKLNPNEEAVNSLSNSFNERRNNNPDAYSDTIILVNDDDQPGKTKKSVSSQPTGLAYNTLYNRRYDDEFNHHEDFYNHLLPFHGPNLRQREQKLTNDSPLTRKFSRKSYSNANAESSLNDELFTDGDNTGKLTVLRLASLEDLNRSNNRKSNHRNFLRLSLSPDNKLTLDEGVASDLSEILSETLDELSLAPVNLRRTDVTSNKYGRRENYRNSAEEDNMSNMFLLRLGNSYNPNTASPLRRYSKTANHSSKRNFRAHGNHTRDMLKKSTLLPSIPPVKTGKFTGRNIYVKVHGNHARQNLTSPPPNFGESTGNQATHNLTSPPSNFDESTGSNRNGNLKVHGNHGRQNLTSPPPNFGESSGNHTRQNLTSPPPNSSEFTDSNPTRNLMVHGNHGKQNLTSPPPDSGESTGSNPKTNLRAHGNPARENFRKLFDENTAKTLVPYHEGKSIKLTNNRQNEDQNNLDTLFAFKKKGNASNNLTVLPPTNQDNLSPEPPRSDEILPKNTSDKLHLEFPWNDQMIPDGDKSKSQLRSDGKKDYTLNLEFPWNSALSPDSDKGKSQLRTDEKKKKTKYTTDTLDLEFPWNEILSPGPLSASGKSQLRSDEKKDKTEDNLHLEFPWNDAQNPDSDKSKSQLRSDEKKDKTKDNLHLEFPWNDALSLDSKQNRSLLRSDETKNKSKDFTDILNLEFPWNEAQSPDADKGKSQLRTDRNSENSIDHTDSLNLEFPWNDALSPDSHKRKSPLRSKNDTKDTTNTLNLEFPWNNQPSPDKPKAGGPKLQSLLRIQAVNRQEKEPKDELKLEFPWNDKTSPDKSSKKQTTLRIPDPFFIHPYLRNRNVNKHPNYFRRSYNKFSEGLRLQNLRDKTAAYHRRQYKRRRNDNLGVVSLSRSSSDRRRQRLRTRENTPPLVTTTYRPLRAGRIGNRKTYNDTVIFPKEIMLML